MSDQQTKLNEYKKKMEVKRLNVALDEELHRKLKLTAFEQGITMSQYITNLLKKELKQEENN